MKPLSTMLDALKNIPDFATVVDDLIATARDVAQLPIVRRVYSYDDIGRHRTHLDKRAVPLEPEIQQTFGLAMSDCGTARIAAGEMPLLAAAYRLTGNDDFKTRLLDQLREVATWSPVQRPGWTCYYRGRRLPPDGRDGSWLATGMGIRAIGNTLEILPGDSLPSSLRRSLEALLETEIAGIVEDWRLKRQWFVRTGNAITNQWVLPTEGLIRACLILGADHFPEAYELGVQNMLRALSAHGDAGEFEEGISYATMTVTSMLHAARAMALRGDDRALVHPFLRHFPNWVVQHLQPGRSGINCFNAGGASPLPRDDARFRQLLSLLAVCTGSESARWALAHQFDGPSHDVMGALAHTLPVVDAGATPARYAVFDRARRVNWRSSWADDATGVWVRGGHALDQHDDADRGHVNFIAHGKPLLIEAGTPPYAHPDIHRLFCSGVGHNVLQVGTAMPETPPHGTGMPAVPGWQVRAVAPLHVAALNDAGGSVTIDASAGYEDVDRWQRTATWTAEQLLVDDDVRLVEGVREKLLFRWHLGTDQPVEIQGADRCWTITWADAQITLTASAAISVTWQMLPDCTRHKVPADGDPDFPHTCLVICTCDAVDAFTLATHVAPTRPEASGKPNQLPQSSSKEFTCD